MRLLFETFRRSGSALKVVRYFDTKGIGWPRRIVSGVRAGELIAAPLAHHDVLRILHNPRYTGAFVYGRTRSAKIPVGGRIDIGAFLANSGKSFSPTHSPATSAGSSTKPIRKPCAPMRAATDTTAGAARRVMERPYYKG